MTYKYCLLSEIILLYDGKEEVHDTSQVNPINVMFSIGERYIIPWAAYSNEMCE